MPLDEWLWGVRASGSNWFGLADLEMFLFRGYISRALLKVVELNVCVVYKRTNETEVRSSFGL